MHTSDKTRKTLTDVIQRTRSATLQVVGGVEGGLWPGKEKGAVRRLVNICVLDLSCVHQKSTDWGQKDRFYLDVWSLWYSISRWRGLEPWNYDLENACKCCNSPQGSTGKEIGGFPSSQVFGEKSSHQIPPKGFIMYWNLLDNEQCHLQGSGITYLVKIL